MPPNTTSTRYGRPFRPLPIRLANLILPTAKLRPEQLRAAAQHKEHLSDFGAPPVEEALGHLCDSINSEAALHPVGAMLIRRRLTNLLRNRLRAQAMLQADPQIAEHAIRSPVIITGLHRSGTSLLHRLLADDPRFRALRSFEGLNPMPLRPGSIGKRDPRRRMTSRAERGIRYLAPDFFAVHPLEAEGLEEDILLLDYSLLSTVAEATMRVPSFANWAEQQNQTPAYQTLRTLLQLLDAQEPAKQSAKHSDKRWLLKTPHHLEWLDVLFAEFPDAKIIWTHRDPIITVASLCSMVSHAYGIMSDVVDPHEIGRHWSRKIGRMMDRAVAYRDQAGDQAFLDINYDDLVADPIGQVRRTEQFLGWNFPNKTESGMRDRLVQHQRHRYGKHIYRLEDFGLDEAELKERYSGYRERFGFV